MSSDQSKVNADRLDELEMKTTFQEQLLADLNDEVTKQTMRLAKLERQMQLLLERTHTSDEEAGRVGENPLDEPPPPHY